MPTFRPDFFAEKRSKSGKCLAQIAVEAEIHSTLYSPHTSEQLVLMDEFITHQRHKKVPVHGFLLIPSGKALLRQARSFLESLFPSGTKIKILQEPR
jgi:hypothetical protein